MSIPFKLLDEELKKWRLIKHPHIITYEMTAGKIPFLIPIVNGQKRISSIIPEFYLTYRHGLKIVKNTNIDWVYKEEGILKNLISLEDNIYKSYEPDHKCFVSNRGFWMLGSVFFYKIISAIDSYGEASENENKKINLIKDQYVKGDKVSFEITTSKTESFSFNFGE